VYEICSSFNLYFAKTKYMLKIKKVQVYLKLQRPHNNRINRMQVLMELTLLMHAIIPIRTAMARHTIDITTTQPNIARSRARNPHKIIEFLPSEFGSVLVCAAAIRRGIMAVPLQVVLVAEFAPLDGGQGFL
jgi:hypothetical protein